MISIICPSSKGNEIAFKLQKSLNAKLYLKENNFSLKECARQAMEESCGIIFISSTGIAVRAIAPFIKGKDKDPGVVCVDLSCRFAINILSGHLGGGNDLTLEVSKILNTEPVITTATDAMGLIGPDVIAKNNNFIIDDLKIAKNIAAMLIDNKIIGIKDDKELLEIPKGYKRIDKVCDNCIHITHNKNQYMDKKNVLVLLRRDIILGIGCKRNTPFDKLKCFIKDILNKHNIDIRSVKKIVSVEVKKDEEGLIELSEYLKCSFETFTIEEIKTVQDKYEKSAFVEKTLGIGNVCESSVDLAEAEVIINKIKHEGMTLAIGVAKNDKQ